MCKSKRPDDFPDCGLLNYNTETYICTLMKYDEFKLFRNLNYIYWGKNTRIPFYALAIILRIRRNIYQLKKKTIQPPEIDSQAPKTYPNLRKPTILSC